MAYKKKTWEFRRAIEVMEYHTARYGAPGQKREKKKKPTKEDMEKVNQYTKERKARHRLRKYFYKNDYLSCCLLYTSFTIRFNSSYVLISIPSCQDSGKGTTAVLLAAWVSILYCQGGLSPTLVGGSLDLSSFIVVHNCNFCEHIF